jgi:4-amino-4-deoxy-L-arabinose transferase-like glycosyltransferase
MPLLAMVAYQWLTPREKHAARLLQWPGLLAFLVLGLGWYVAMVVRHPQLTSYFIGDEIVNRVASDKFGRNPEWYQPFTMYLPLLLLGGGLWGYYPVRFLGTWRWWRPETWRQLRREASPGLFLVLWMVLPLTIFCLSKSRLPNYVVPLFPITALVTAYSAARTWREERFPRRLAWIAVLSACGVILVKGLAGYTPEVGQQLLRFEKPEAVQKLGKRLVRRSKADASRLYRLCQPWDTPATTRFVLYEQPRFFGFDVYAQSPVVRAMEEPPVTVHPRHLPQVLQEITDRSVPQTRHVFICRDYTVPSFRQRLDQAGLHADDVASDAFWHLLVVSAP